MSYRDEVVLGRHPDCDVVLEGSGISRRHARIVRKEGSFFLMEEAGVTNGTYLNGKRLQGGVLTPIQFGDELCFAHQAA